jgi:hypothetical protein
VVAELHKLAVQAAGREIVVALDHHDVIALGNDRVFPNGFHGATFQNKGVLAAGTQGL